MADVRLTAINPEDSSAVPVACNEKGELKLEAPPEFDGTVDGDLVVTGKGTFGSTQSVIGDDGSAQFASGAIDFYSDGKATFAGGSTTFEANGQADFLNGDITFGSDGNATFGGNVDMGSAHVGRPNDCSRSPYYGITQRGSMYSHGGNDVSLLWNGYRNVDNTWTSFGSSDSTAACAIRLGMTGRIRFCTEETKPTGSHFDIPVAMTVLPTQEVCVGRTTAATLFDVNGEISLVSRNTRYTIVEQSGLAHLVPVTEVRDEESEEDVVATTVERPPLRDIPAELTMVEQQLQKVMEMLRLTPEAGWEVWDGSD